MFIRGVAATTYISPGINFYCQPIEDIAILNNTCLNEICDIRLITENTIGGDLNLMIDYLYLEEQNKVDINIHRFYGVANLVSRSVVKDQEKIFLNIYYRTESGLKTKEYNLTEEYFLRVAELVCEEDISEIKKDYTTNREDYNENQISIVHNDQLKYIGVPSDFSSATEPLENWTKFYTKKGVLSTNLTIKGYINNVPPIILVFVLLLIFISGLIIFIINKNFFQKR